MTKKGFPERAEDLIAWLRVTDNPICLEAADRIVELETAYARLEKAINKAFHLIPSGVNCAYAYWDVDYDCDDTTEEGTISTNILGPFCGCGQYLRQFGGGAAACGGPDECKAYWRLRTESAEFPACAHLDFDIDDANCCLLGLSMPCPMPCEKYEPEK